MPRRDLEDQLTMAVASWLTAQKPDCIWFHVPNGGARRKSEAGQFKAMGVRAGVPDLAFILNGGQAAFIELKVGRNTLTPEQKLFAEQAQALGALFAEARSLDHVIDTLRRWDVRWGAAKWAGGAE